MAEVGVVLVGPVACGLALEIPEPVARVLADPITPLDEDLPAMVELAARSTFQGPDADRWRFVTAPTGPQTPKGARLREQTELLWACAQVQSAALDQVVSGWDSLLVVAWIDEAGLVPVVRALLAAQRPITVLLGGNLEAARPGRARANQAALADLLRARRLAMVIHNEAPSEVIDVAMDAARTPQTSAPPAPSPVDLGPLLELPPTWVAPAPPVEMYQLVHVPMGHAAGLARLAVDVASWQALYDLIHGPPVDLPGAIFSPPEQARARLPQDDLDGRIHRDLRVALSKVRFQGKELLVAQIERMLRPVLDEVHAVRRQVIEVERLRLQNLRAFTAVGIHYTVQNLDSRLDAIHSVYPGHLLDELDELLSGESAATEEGRVHVTAWRHLFAGLTSEVAPTHNPGAAVARRLVRERYELFASEFAASVARALNDLVARARDPDTPPSTRELRALRERALRVQGTLEEALSRLDARVHAGCVEAVRDDRFVRWAAPQPEDLRQLLVSRIQSLATGPELDHLMTAALSRRPLGIAEDRDFEGYLRELAVDVYQVPSQATKVPSYEQVLLLVLQGRDPPVLRQALARSAGTEVELHLERPVEPALMSWLTATGMLVVVAPRLQTCAIYWQRAPSLTPISAEAARDHTTDHFLADLTLAPVEGDDVASLTATVRAAVGLLVGLIVGELAVVRLEGMAVHRLVATHLDAPDPLLLPHAGLHWLLRDSASVQRLLARIKETIARLPTRPDALETVRKLVEIAHLGPAPTLAAQLGMYGGRVELLEQPIHALLEAHANQAVAAMVDVLHTDELLQLSRLPTHRSLLDVQQLGPSGGRH